MSSNQIKKYTPSVIIYNSLLRSGQYKLRAIELYFYILLAKRKSSYDEKVIITLNTIYKIQTLYTVEGNNTTGNMKKIRSILLSMQSKNVISIDVDVTDKTTAKNDDVLVINFPEVEFEKGYLPANASILDVTDNPYKLYILCFIKHQKDDKKMEQSIEGWSTVLGCDEKTAKTYLDELQDEGRIHCIVGEKYIDGNGHYKQHPTKWFLGAPVVADNTSVVHVSSALESNVEPHITSEVKEKVATIVSKVNKNNADATQFKWGNWKDTKVFPDDDDYDLYFEQSHIPAFIEQCERRIKGLSKSEKSKEIVEKKIEEARERADRKIRDQQHEKREEANDEIIRNRHKGIIFEDPAQQHALVLIDIETFKNISANQLKQYRTLYYDFIEKDEHSNNFYEQDHPFNNGSAEERSLIGNCSDETILLIRDRMVEQFIEHKKVDIKELEKYRDSVLAERNKNVPFDVPHEGDFISYSPYSGEVNESLHARKIKHSNAKDRAEASVSKENADISSHLSTEQKDEELLPF